MDRTRLERALNAKAMNWDLIVKAAVSHVEQERERKKVIVWSGGMF